MSRVQVTWRGVLLGIGLLALVVGAGALAMPREAKCTPPLCVGQPCMTSAACPAGCHCISNSCS